MTTIEEIRQNRTPTRPAQPKDSIGLIWMSMLIEFDYKTGESKILRSFSRPAKESSIKQFKAKKKEAKQNIVFKEPTEATKLF